jgi:acyl dehydratase
MRIDEIRAATGREVGTSQWLTVTQEMIDRFADVTDDHQWIHVDVERARRESPFGTTIAHGFLTTSLLPKMIHEAVEMEIPSRLTVNYGFNRLRYVSPVPAGRRIRAHITPNAVKDVEGGCEIAWGVTVEIEGKEKPALAAEWLIRIYYA